MSNFVLMKYICKQMNLPCCQILYGSILEYSARSEIFRLITISNPATIILLIAIIFCTIRIIKRVRKSYTSTGRREMILFFYFYLYSITLEAINLTGFLSKFVPDATTYYTAVQLAFANTSVLALIIGSSFSSISILDYGFSAGKALKIGCFFALFVYVILSAFVLTTKNGLVLFLEIIVINSIFFLVYIFIQFKRLINKRREIWAYGNLTVAVSFFLMGTIPMFYGASIIAWLSDRYLDSLFFFHLFIFCAIIMVHKLWLSTSEDEEDCVPLKIRDLKTPDYNETRRK
ncbi:hypothetical protein EDEG_00688 [Edhazardia aedis USNM 41457]|uniref:Uncharacterized protein n=1 Tax=Edhazardia aedis (strain USNM 41457) TaxID=1003232 RepID=J8ZZZ7_EDHAE|nr:hypothetical protein EDEG_00688 [Edhazardia aedis USNM 41457]|eukprot:EJW05223.1 hypothetical protein EDEG_00688 [Edhazardia aedis USNM 41457]